MSSKSSTSYTIQNVQVVYTNERRKRVNICILLADRCCKPMLEWRRYIAVVWFEQALMVTKAQ